MILINFKTYPESSGERGRALAQALDTVAASTHTPVVICPQAFDLKVLTNLQNINVWLQHADPVYQGQSTGWIVPEIGKQIGASGVILNHSEHKLEFGVLQKTVERSREASLKVLIFAADPDEAKKVDKLNPDYIGYEPPELIGSRKTSVAKAKPEVIDKVVEVVKAPVLVGAGVKSRSDVEVSLQRGAVGVALASGLVKAADPAAVLKDLLSVF